MQRIGTRCSSTQPLPESALALDEETTYIFRTRHRFGGQTQNREYAMSCTLHTSVDKHAAAYFGSVACSPVRNK